MPLYPLGEQGRWAKPIPKETEVIPAIYHCSIQIIGRSKGRSAVGAAAYRSGEKILNTWDGVTHDYINKGGIIYKEILLPSHAPPQYTERAVLWNAVEQIEKNKHAQLARDCFLLNNFGKPQNTMSENFFAIFMIDLRRE